MVRSFIWVSILTFICVIQQIGGKCQSFSNMVPNHSFEDIQISSGDCQLANAICSCTYFQLFNYWAARTYPWRVPQKLNSFCGPPGTSDVLCDGGHIGNQFAQAMNGEWFTVELYSEMNSSKKYYVEFWIRNGTGNSQVGLNFFNEHPKWCSGNLYGETGNSVGINYSPWDKIENGWRRIFALVEPIHNFRFINFGAFNKNSGACIIDDVTIIELGEDCPSENLFENCTFPTINSFRFQASDKLKAGYDVNPSNNSNGPAIVPIGANITFTAENEISLLDGFSVQEGANFAAFLSPCNCPPIEFSAPKFYNSCQPGVQINIGDNAQIGKTYTWTSDPPEAIDFLSNPNSSNPTFTGPSDFNGNISYNLFIDGTEYGVCNGVTGSYQVDILYYSDPPSANSTITLNSITYEDDTLIIDAITESTTQMVKIEVLKDGQEYKTYLLNKDVDFTDGLINFFTTDVFTQCYDYTVRVSGQNLCFNEFGSSVSQELDLENNANAEIIKVTNGFNNGDGNNQNDFGVWYRNADTYDLTIFNRFGTDILFNETNQYLPISQPAIIWNGVNNSNNNLNAGTYFFVLTLHSSCGNSETTSEDVTIFSSVNKLSESAENDDQNNNKPFYSYYPNPNSGVIYLKYTQGFILSYELISIIGKSVQISNISSESSEHILNLEMLTKGTYFLKLKTIEGIKTERIVYQ